MQPTIPSKRLRLVIGTLAALILLCLAFMLGTKAGERRSRHFCNWSEHYPEMMRPPRGGRGSFMPTRPMPLPHGVFGRVLSATGTTLLIEGKDHFEQAVLIGTSTAIRTDRGVATSTDIQANMQVGVFGSPNAQGQIEAYLIRLFPERR